ncbi:MAG: PHP domain-containing protein [Clostridia bacterium]|nr:PHP domain-containing protein [Clostridia bacterium]
MKVSHDIHVHTRLSSCCGDERMTAQRIVDFAEKKGYDTVCITDHCWDSAAPGASDWYAPQNVEHVFSAGPLPSSDSVRVLMGCETEYCGGRVLGLSRAAFDKFDFVVIPPNHFHMENFVRPAHITSPKDRAELLMTRLEELQQLDLPWRKIGIAHLSCPLICRNESVSAVFHEMPDERLHRIFRVFAQRGTGIELNSGSFPASEDFAEIMRPYLIARDEGCKFYFSSDAHSVAGLEIDANLAPAIEALQLQPEQLYVIP